VGPHALPASMPARTKGAAQKAWVLQSRVAGQVTKGPRRLAIRDAVSCPSAQRSEQADHQITRDHPAAHMLEGMPQSTVRMHQHKIRTFWAQRLLGYWTTTQMLFSVRISHYLKHASEHVWHEPIGKQA